MLYYLENSYADVGYTWSLRELVEKKLRVLLLELQFFSLAYQPHHHHSCTTVVILYTFMVYLKYICFLSYFLFFSPTMDLKEIYFLECVLCPILLFLKYIGQTFSLFLAYSQLGGEKKPQLIFSSFYG